MSDPTELTLRLSFFFALGLFVVTAIARRLMRGRPVVIEQEMVPVSGQIDAAISPYFPPALEVSAAGPPPLPEEARGIPIRHYRAFDFLWMGFIFMIFGGLSISSAQAVGSDVGAKIDVNVLVISIGFQLIIALATVAVVWRRIHPVQWLGLAWRRWPLVIAIAPFTVLSMWAVFAGIEAAGYSKWLESLGVERMQETVKLLQDSTDPTILVLMAVTAVLVAPVCEELVFRGYLYPAAKRFAGPWVAGICTALVFGAAHGSLAALLPLFLFGLVLVFLYEKTGSIWAPMAAHFCFNGLTVLIQMLDRVYHFTPQ